MDKIKNYMDYFNADGKNMPAKRVSDLEKYIDWRDIKYLTENDESMFVTYSTGVYRVTKLIKINNVYYFDLPNKIEGAEGLLEHGGDFYHGREARRRRSVSPSG